MLDLMKEPEPWYGFKFCEGKAGKSFLDIMDDSDLSMIQYRNQFDFCIPFFIDMPG